jgi:ribose/xylose/arabinose/galactoside ABC-type transport system permease subunit
MQKVGKKMLSWIKKFSLILTFLLLVIICSWASPYFLTSENIWVLLRQITVIGTIAIGMTFVILSAGIDLSVGSVVALVSVVSMSAQKFGVPAIILVGIGVGISAGLFNGLLITFGKVVPFITTLGMMTIAHGLALWYSGQGIIHGQLPQFEQLGNGWINFGLFKVPIPVIIFSILFLLGWLLLERTIFGKYVKAIGGNTEAARMSGININFWLILTYVYCGLMTAVSGLIITSRMNTGSPMVGQYYELDAIAAVIIGGTNLFGGRGTLTRTLLGVLILGAVANIMNLLNWPSDVQYTIRGVIILIAVMMQRGSGE